MGFFERRCKALLYKELGEKNKYQKSRGKLGKNEFLNWNRGFQAKKEESKQNRGFLRKPQINTDFLPQITQIFEC